VKRGLTVPLAPWLAGPLLPFAHMTLERLDSRVFNRSAVTALLDDHAHRRRDNRRELWALIMLQLWREAYAFAGARCAPSSSPRADAAPHIAVG
jgi:asparagine synthase (glutamine-hydrolysing)